MASLVKIGQRILNLDQIAFVERLNEAGTIKVVVYYEQGKRFTTPLGQQPYRGTKDDPIITPLNMSFSGDDAEYVWQKLSQSSESWDIPSERVDRP